MPVIIYRDGRPWACMGTPGGDVQPQAMAQVFLNMAEFGMNPQDAVEAPRFATYSFPNSFCPHTYEPGVLRIEGPVPAAVREELAGMGHRVETWPDWEWEAGAVLVVCAEPDGLLARRAPASIRRRGARVHLLAAGREEGEGPRAEEGCSGASGGALPAGPARGIR
jgi:gamma-glutamyltranspeptidase